jgi:lipoate-protein ligase B
MRQLRYLSLGRIPFERASALQEALRQRVLAGESEAETLLLVEHDPVITLGRRANRTHVLASPALLSSRGIEVVTANRGGEVTYHGPGQLVAYPVMRLSQGVLQHVESLAAAVVEVAESTGVRAVFRRDCPGVWVEDRKLAAIGIHVHRRVAVHGIAFNIATALEDYSLIVSCGMTNLPTSLSREVGRAIAIGEVQNRFLEALGRSLGRTLVEAQLDAHHADITRCFPYR